MRAPASELLVVETARVRVTWSGAYAVKGESRVRFFRHEGSVRASGAAPVSAPEVEVPLAVKEESVLSLLVESRSDARAPVVAVLHRDPGQTSGLVRANNGRTIHGSVRVRDEAGWSVFTILVGGAPEAEIVLQILPSKVSPVDVLAMREDVAAAWRGAALAAWSATESPHALSPEASVPAWVSLVRHAASELEGPLAEIARRPAFELSRTPRTIPAARLRGHAQSTRSILRQRGSGTFVRILGVPVRERVPVGVLREDENIAAHQWIRQRLDRAIGNLAMIRYEEAAQQFADHGRRLALRTDLEAVDATLRRYCRQRPLAEAKGARVVRRAPLVLRRRPVYRQVFEAIQRLEHGLDVAAGEVATSWLGTARLYEAWSVLRVVQTLAAVLGTSAPESPFGVTAYGARMRIGRGARQAVVLRGRDVEAEVAYEPMFSGPPGLLAQRPDLLLTLRAPGRAPRRAVLDAKYRRDDSAAYTKRHGSPGPPEAALGDLHRYRDAIVDASGEPLVEAAAALFPLHAREAFGASRLWRAHATVGIGAIPLVPGSDVWLRRWILAWLSNEESRS